MTLKQMLKLTKKGVLLFLIFQILSTAVYAQEAPLIINGKDITVQKRKEFVQSINKEFTKVITGTGFSNLGNFAAISTDAKSFTVAGNLVSKKTIIGFELAGGATEGVLKLFNNNELNSNFSGELKIHKLFRVKEPALDLLEGFNIDNQIEELNIQHLKELNEIIKLKDIDKIKLDITSDENRLTELRKNLLIVDSLLKISGNSNDTKDSLNFVRETQKLEIENYEALLGIQELKLEKIEKDKGKYLDNLLEISTQKKDEKFRTLNNKKQDRNLQSYEFTWYSIGFRAKNNSLKLFNNEDLQMNQFSDTSFVSQRLSASISKFIKSPFPNKDVFWSAGLFLDYTTNLNTLKSVEIEEIVEVSGNSQQNIVRKINAFQGAYEEELLDFTIYYDYYIFFGFDNSKFGVHINPSFNYSEFLKKPMYNFYLGLIFPFLEKEKQVSSINIELFYNRMDLLNYLNKDVKNTTIGLRVAIPLSKINK